MVDARCERTLVDASVCQQHYCVSKASSHYKTVKRTISTFALIIGGPVLPDSFCPVWKWTGVKERQRKDQFHQGVNRKYLSAHFARETILSLFC